MDAQHNPAGLKAESHGSTANDKGVARWRLILLVLCAVGVGLVAGILALQFAEYRFYQAAPNVWPPRRPAAGQGATLPQTWQPGSGGTVSVPIAKLSVVTATTSSAAPATVSTPTPALAPTSAPSPAAVSTSAPAAVKP